MPKSQNGIFGAGGVQKGPKNGQKWPFFDHFLSILNGVSAKKVKCLSPRGVREIGVFLGFRNSGMQQDGAIFGGYSYITIDHDIMVGWFGWFIYGCS